MTNKKTTVIYHSADFDGIFCREIARKSLGENDVNYIGWNFGDEEIPIPQEGTVYILDLPPDCLLGMGGGPGWKCLSRIIWIDHHKSSIEQWRPEIPGYRIDGVAACRLAWQWFYGQSIATKTGEAPQLPAKEHYLRRTVSEPLAVRLAGEYDVWDHRGDGDLEFQYGLRTEEPDTHWPMLLSENTGYTDQIVKQGKLSMRYAKNMDALWLSESWHIIEWEGRKFLAQNSVQRGSGILDSKDFPETGHDSLMLYGFRGKLWTVSLYHAKHRTDLDLSLIAVKYGGGGHRGACGFTCHQLPFANNLAKLTSKD